jgi:hypothetical protein
MLDTDTWSQWASYHDSCFNGFIENFIFAAPEREEIWRQALGGYSLAELKQASYAIFAATEKPVGWTSHMESMQRHLRRFRDSKREQENAAQYARRCGLCQGFGLVSAVALDGFDFVTSGGAKVKHGTAACKCALGDKYRSAERDGVKHGFPDFDAGQMESLEVWRGRQRQPDPERDEAAKSLKATLAYCKAQFANFGTPPPAAEVKR